MVCLHFCFSGSRDSKMALWLIQDESDETTANSQLSESSQDRGSCMDVPLYGHIRPQVIEECNKAEKVRALAYHSKRQVREAASHYWYHHMPPWTAVLNSRSNLFTAALTDLGHVLNPLLLLVKTFSIPCVLDHMTKLYHSNQLNEEIFF